MTIRPKEFDAGVLDCERALKRFAASLTRDSVRAQDLVQDTILKALLKFDNFEQGTNLKGWLFTIMRNHYLSGVRRKRLEIEDADGAIAERMPASDNQEVALELKQTHRLMRLMPTDLRKAVELVGLMGYAYEEAAEALCIPIGTVKSRVNRAREFLETGYLESEEEVIAPPPPKYVFNPDDVARLYHQGKSVSEIAEELPGSTRGQVMDVILDRKLKPRKS